MLIIIPSSVFFYCYLNKWRYAVVVLYFYCSLICKDLQFFNKWFINYTCESYLIKNSIPMGAIKNFPEIFYLSLSYPGWLPKCYFYFGLKYFHLSRSTSTQSRSNTRGASRGSEACRRPALQMQIQLLSPPTLQMLTCKLLSWQTLQMLMQLLSWSCPESSRAYLTNVNNKR